MTTTQPRWRVGQQVGVDHPDHPGVWTIKSQGSVNAMLEQQGRLPLRAPKSMLIEPGAARASDAPSELFDLGEVIQISNGRHAGLWVVIADRGQDKVNLAALGGGKGGLYLSGVPKRGLVKVAVKDLPSLLEKLDS